MTFERSQIHILRERLSESPRFLIVVTGPRQIGKSTMVYQALNQYPSSFVSTDNPIPPKVDPFTQTTHASSAQTLPGTKPTAEWLILQWTQARAQAKRLPKKVHYILAIDEIQKIPQWSEIVKGLWDTDRAEQTPLHVILLGSSPWLMQKGLTESLAGRYESIPMTHWSYYEMQEAFNFTLEEFIYFGGYPGSASFIRDESRWRHYIQDSLIRPNIDKDILQMTRVDKPALLKQLFELGCSHYSGQIISFTKLLGQLQDAGNTVTLTHYLDLLSQAGLLTGLPKYTGTKLRQRASTPKMNTHNTALTSALGGYTFQEAQSDRSYWGRLVESAIGTHLINNKPPGYDVFYWRESPDEVDFIVTKGDKLLAIEVKSGLTPAYHRGLEAFTKKYKKTTSLIIGEGSVSIQKFLLAPIESWLE